LKNKNQELGKENKTLDNNFKNLQGQISEREKEIEQTQITINELQQKLANVSESNIEKQRLQQQLNKVNEILKKIKSELKVAEEKNEELKKDIRRKDEVTIAIQKIIDNNSKDETQQAMIIQTPHFNKKKV